MVTVEAVEEETGPSSAARDRGSIDEWIVMIESSCDDDKRDKDNEEERKAAKGRAALCYPLKWTRLGWLYRDRQSKSKSKIFRDTAASQIKTWSYQGLRASGSISTPRALLIIRGIRSAYCCLLCNSV